MPLLPAQGVSRVGEAELPLSYKKSKANNLPLSFLTVFPVALTLKWAGLTLDPREQKESCSNWGKTKKMRYFFLGMERNVHMIKQMQYSL